MLVPHAQLNLSSHTPSLRPVAPDAAGSAPWSVEVATGAVRECGPLLSARWQTCGAVLAEATAELFLQLPEPTAVRISGVKVGGSAAQLTAAGVFLLVGVQSGPSERHLARRNAIRHSWIRWENVGRTVLVCFLLGRRELRPGALRRLEAEAAENGDVLWLTNATDEGVPTLKGYEWWRTAASLPAWASSAWARHMMTRHARTRHVRTWHAMAWHVRTWHAMAWQRRMAPPTNCRQM